MSTTPQPNFENLKTCFYRAFVNSEAANKAIMLQSVSNLDFRSYFKKRPEFQKDFNNWLNGIDIRQSATIIDILKENDKTVPKWMAKGEYFIDYNDKGFLDLIRITESD